MGEGKDTRARGWYEYERESVVREEKEEKREGRRRIPPAVRLGWPDPRMSVFGRRCLSGVGTGQPYSAFNFPTLICSQL